MIKFSGEVGRGKETRKNIEEKKTILKNLKPVTTRQLTQDLSDASELKKPN